MQETQILAMGADPIMRDYWIDGKQSLAIFDPRSRRYYAFHRISTGWGGATTLYSVAELDCGTITIGGEVFATLTVRDTPEFHPISRMPGCLKDALVRLLSQMNEGDREVLVHFFATWFKITIA